MNFELILVVSVVVTGLIVFVDYFFFAPERKLLYGPKHPPHWILEYAHAFFPILLVVLLLRSFIVEPFRIPSGSLKPTLLDGDFVFVSKFSYGLRLPLLHTQILSTGEPARGDIAVFRWPMDTHIDYIKRIVGLPGDRISYMNKVLFINGKPMTQTMKSYVEDTTPYDSEPYEVAVKKENLGTMSHDIYLRADVLAQNFSNIEVPPGKYFVMGDNRDDSKDSRSWGFVPKEDLAGKAVLVWFSWDSKTYRVRWNRIGMRIH